MLISRIAIWILSAGMFPACIGWVAAADYPTRSIRLLVGYDPGGGTDQTARTIGNNLTARLGHPVVTDNRPGIGGVVARNIAAQASPDGYTLLLISGSQVIGASLVYGNRIDMQKTYTSISRLTTYPFPLVTHPSSPATTVKEMIALAKSKPGAFNYGSTGVGSMAHLASELFKEMAQVNMVHVSYKGASAGLLDLMRGQIQLTFTSATASVPLVKAGKVRVLGVSSINRSKNLPDVPTIAEGGLPGFDVTGWFALAAPAGTPRAVIARLNREIGEVLKSPDVQKVIEHDGADPAPSTPEELTAIVNAEESKWIKLVKSAGINLK